MHKIGSMGHTFGVRVDGTSSRRFLRFRRGRFLRLTGPMGRRVLKFDDPSGRGLWWRLRRKFYNAAFGGLRAQIIKKAGPPPPVISTVAKRSGEISPSDGSGGITVGDLSTQSIMGAFSICPIPTCSPARDDGVSEQHWTHLRCEGSPGSKGKVLRMDRP